MIVFNTNSWHFKIILYIFGEEFFTKVKGLEFNHEDGSVIEIREPKIVNLCPYCRALVGGILIFPFVVLGRKILPKRERKPFDIKKSKRNTKIIKIAAICLVSALGIHNLIIGNYWMAIFDFAIASIQIWFVPFFKKLGKWLDKRQENKPRKVKEEKIKNPNLVMTYLKSNHDKVCPPIAFVDENDTNIRR